MYVRANKVRHASRVLMCSLYCFVLCCQAMARGSVVTWPYRMNAHPCGHVATESALEACTVMHMAGALVLQQRLHSVTTLALPKIRGGTINLHARRTSASTVPVSPSWLPCSWYCSNPAHRSPTGISAMQKAPGEVPTGSTLPTAGRCYSVPPGAAHPYIRPDPALCSSQLYGQPCGN